MKVKVLHISASRDDKIVSAYEEVTFENEYMGWYVDCPDKGGLHQWDNIAVVERIGTVCFVACYNSRNALTPELFQAVAEEAQHLQAAMQRRIASGQWIPLTYIAAFEALGWDSRPLKCHREHICSERMKKDMERRQQAKEAEDARLLEEKRRLKEADDARLQEEEQRLQEARKECKQRFMQGEKIEANLFIYLCEQENISIHPRTLQQLRKQIDWLSKTQVAFKSYNKGNRMPQGKGCFALIGKLSDALNRQKT